jgi:hypothetical protein
MPNRSPIENAVKIIGESVIAPGASQLLEGTTLDPEQCMYSSEWRQGF